MSGSTAIRAVQAFFGELGGGDLDAIARHTSSKVVCVIYGEDDAAKSVIPWAGNHHGHDALKAAFSAIHAALRVEKFSIEAMFAKGDVVAIFGRYEATAVATGRRFAMPFAQRARVVDALIVDCIMSEDSQAVATALRQSCS